MEDRRGRENTVEENNCGWHTLICFSSGCYVSPELPVGLLSEFSSPGAGSAEKPTQPLSKELQLLFFLLHFFQELLHAKGFQ